MVRALQVFSAALFFASQVLASPEPSEAIAGLVARQVPGFDPSTVPSACQSDCGAVSTSLSGCSSVSCICKDSTISGLGKCLSCGVSISGSGLDAKTAQSAIDQVVDSCKSAGSPVDSVTISAKGSSDAGSNSDTKGNGAAHSIVIGAGAVAVAAMGAFAIFA